MSTITANTKEGTLSQGHKKVIFASSLGTVFEWYDFYLYGSLAAIIAKQFFSGLNETSLTGLGITKGAQSAHLNLIYTPLPKLDLGAELIWGQRELENGDRGDLNRLQTHVKYNF